QPSGGAWRWPDPHEVTAPPVRAGRPVRSSEVSTEALWPSDLPEQSWPPLPEPDRPARRAEAPQAPRAPEPAIPGATRVFVPDPEDPAFDRGRDGWDYHASARFEGPTRRAPLDPTPAFVAAGWAEPAPAAAVVLPLHD